MYSSMFSSARIGWPAATEPTSGRPGRDTERVAHAVLAVLPDAVEQLDRARLGRVAPQQAELSRFARCACTVDDEARPTALPMSRTVGG